MVSNLGQDFQPHNGNEGDHEDHSHGGYRENMIIVLTCGALLLVRKPMQPLKQKMLSW
ncbi:hypothetical protein [Siminovitchia terrae]|uniref:hypothetical protein n=1 Tax=Siminovitchia terrae TaxID=1914933 RepID=UPI0028A692BB|nr:hypothetical protein [Siminovitchia terrae]